MAKRIKHRHRTERTAAYAEYDEIFEFCANLRRRNDDVAHDVLLIVRKLRPAHPARAAILFKIGIRVLRLCLYRGDFLFGNTLGADIGVHHIVEIEFNHFSPPTRFFKYSTDCATSR